MRLKDKRDCDWTTIILITTFVSTFVSGLFSGSKNNKCVRSVSSVSMEEFRMCVKWKSLEYQVCQVCQTFYTSYNGDTDTDTEEVINITVPLFFLPSFLLASLSFCHSSYFYSGERPTPPKECFEDDLEVKGIWICFLQA